MVRNEGFWNRVKNLRKGFPFALCLLWTGCDHPVVVEEGEPERSKVPETEELAPVKEQLSEKPVAPLSEKEGKVRLGALMGRLEEASEQVARAEDDLPLVFGAVADAKGNRYVGQLRDGKRHGYGSYQFANGDRYEGGYQNGRRHGYGTYQFKKGDRYVGYFKNGRYHDYGAYLFTNGDQYFGQYEEGQRNGKGTLARANGERYEGDFKNGKRHGLGQCTFSNGDRYDGSWKEDEPDGWGTYHYYRKQKGNEQENFAGKPIQPNLSRPLSIGGEGNLEQEALAAGDKFLEQALARPPGGQPVAASTIPPGPLIRSVEGDDPLSPSLKELSGGDRYVGQLEDGQPHGQGAYLFSDGESYVGDFLHGQHHGQGLLVLGDGSRYLGEWENGLRHGYGVLYDPTGKVQREGHWNKDEPVEE